MLASVIICMRNEAGNLPLLINKLMEQQCSVDYEVILVNDFSTDNSFEIASYFADRHKNICVIHLESLIGKEFADIPNKKKGISEAVKIAKGKYIITTDADCCPGKYWLQSMTEYAEQQQADMVCGPVAIEPGNNLLIMFQEADLAALMSITKITVENKIPALCNGANLLYKKELFETYHPYESNLNEHSGDDIFLLQKFAANKRKIAYAHIADAIVTTKPQITWKGFFHQRIRWAGKASAYKSLSAMLLAVAVFLFNLSFPVLLIAGIFRNTFLPILLLLFILKLLTDYFIIRDALKFFNKKRLAPLLPLFEILHIGYIIFFGVFSLRKSYIWKERKVNR